MTDASVRVTRSRAVLIGVSNYDDDALPDLPSGAQAVEELAQVIAGRASADAALVHTIVNPRRDEVARALADACSEADDQLVVYFAGHGVVSPFGELVLATSDCELRAPELTGMAWNSVRDALADAQAKSVVVILDCCFSGAANSAWQESWTSTEANPELSQRPKLTYLMAGRAPWPYQPGILGAALRTVLDAVPAEGGTAPDFAAVARQLRREMDRVSQPKLVTSDSRLRANDLELSPVYISFRVSDSGVAALLERALADRLGAEQVFRTRRSIQPGDDFVVEILDTIHQARVMVAIIGQGWENKSTKSTDWVVNEIATAFENDIPVVPVLVGPRGRLRAEDLPERIQKLANLQVLQLRNSNAHEVIDGVVGRLLEVL